MNNKRVFSRASSSGFTLIELIVVIFIIAIIAAMVVINVNSARKTSRDARRMADISSIQLAVEMYKDGAGAGKYPDTSDSWFDTTRDEVKNALRPYLFPVPVDPLSKNNSSYKYLVYVDSPDNVKYWIRTLVEEEDNKNIGKRCYCVIGGANPDFNWCNSDTFCN